MRRLYWLYWLALVMLILTAKLITDGYVFGKYDIEDVSQVLYEAGLLPTRHLTMTADPEDVSGIEIYSFIIKGPHLSRTYRARIEIFPSYLLQKRIQQADAEAFKVFGITRNVFVKGNVMLTVSPALPEAEAEKYRQALESLD